MKKNRQEIKPKEKKIPFIHSYPRTLSLLIGIVLSLILLLIVEVGCYVLNISKEEKYFTNNKILSESEDNYSKKHIRYGYFQEDKLLGYKPPPNVKVSAIKKTERKTAYNVIYSFDKYSRRITPVDNHEKRTDYILFFGGSFAFGEGVNDNGTIPFYFSNLAINYMPYNYGFTGYGPQGMLARLQGSEITEEINEAHGILVYVFIDDHLKRAIGSMRVVSMWGHDMPYYTIDKNGRLIRKGNFETGRPVLTFIYRMIYKSQFAKFIRLKLPLRTNDDHIKLTSKIIEESRNEFRKKFNSNEFYVLFYPGPYRSKHREKMMHYLREAKIKVLDYAELIDMTKKGFSIQGDGHPTARAHWCVARRLAEDIGILDGRREEINVDSFMSKP